MAFDTLFRSLVFLKWRGIAFPFSELQTEFTHDLARHKSPDRDGEFIEATGRGARMITGKAHFRNGITFGRKYSNLPLFPDTFKLFEAACANRTTGELIHPVHGSMQCKVVSFKESLVATQRDGIDVDIQWIETGDTDDTPSGLSPIADALASAEQIDFGLTTLKAQLNRLKLPKGYSFADAVRSIQAATDTLSLLQKRGVNAFRNIIQNLRDVERAIDAARDIALAPFRLQVRRCIASCFEMERKVLVIKETKNYVVPRLASIAVLSRRLNTSVADLIRLNPFLSGTPLVAANVVLRYYP